MPRGHGRRGRRRHGGGDRFGGDAFPGGARLESGELQLLLLSLLAERPAHGYELMRVLEERSERYYLPSPGMIYPALTYLEEIGHAVVTQEANRKRYALTVDGLAELEAKRGEADALFEGLARVGSRMARVREAYAGLDGADSATANELHRARHALDHALADKRGCEPDEARRIVRIIDAAVAEILVKREP